ncbi:hypothetical protein diail_8202 [Diaporthe ilicicola]|nr:hypothetical protein diail_8202 [Diaporthe ilicicola]
MSTTNFINRDGISLSPTCISTPDSATGVVVRPEHRLAPITIRPWTDFEQQQAVLWDAVVEATADMRFPYHDHVFETGQELALIDCEAAVQLCDTDLIHKPAARILNSIGKDQGVSSALSRTLGHRSLELGHYFFSTHRNQLNDVIPQIAGSKRTQEGDLIGPHASSSSDATDSRPKVQGRQGQEGEVQEDEEQSLYVPREWAEQQFRAGPTDGFCNFKGVERNDGMPPTRRILFAYELKAPHKLRWSMIAEAGLASNSTTLDMRRDVWERNDAEDNIQDEDPLIVTAGVITQLYDFMIRRRVK